MRRSLALPVLLPLAVSAWGDASSLLKEAEAALAEGIPQVAIVKLKAAINQPATTAATQESARWLLAEAHLAAGHPDEALAALEGLPEKSDRAAMLLRANIDAAAGHWSNAFRRYQELS